MLAYTGLPDLALPPSILAHMLIQWPAFSTSHKPNLYHLQALKQAFCLEVHLHDLTFVLSCYLDLCCTVTF